MIKFLLLQLVALLIKNSSSCVVNTVCENQNIAIDCGKGNVIGIIDAEYGRRDDNTCEIQDYFDVTKPCLSPYAKNSVIERCQKKQSCTVKATNDDFGDPCKDISKYLTVKHSCLTKTPVHCEFNTAITYAHVKTEMACEKQFVTIECKDGKLINIVDAFYGRENKHICNQERSFIRTCFATNALGKVQDLCKGKSSCRVQATNDLFGNPCELFQKYLRVEYTCEKSGTRCNEELKQVQPLQEKDRTTGVKVRTDLGCKNEFITLECINGELINIEDAFYGREDKHTCKVRTFKNRCFATNSIAKVQQLCQGKKSCRVQASNDLFGDPCYLVDKYLRVDYSCRTSMNGLACENNDLSISCGHGEIINVLYAFYGRDDKTTCGIPSNFNSICSFDDSLNKVKLKCQGRRTCQIKASNVLFNNPCPDFIKYLKLNYSCEKDTY